jgi:tRNA C32,U32 (ribose-2'-O)-methylase TrmJ
MKAILISLLTLTGLMPLSLTDKNESYPSNTSISKDSAPKLPYVKQKEIEVIDNELESLMNLRDYYATKMHRYKSRAMRYELQGENLEESKQLTMEADKIDGVIKQIDDEIIRLEKERSLLLKS